MLMAASLALTDGPSPGTEEHIPARRDETQEPAQRLVETGRDDSMATTGTASANVNKASRRNLLIGFTVVVVLGAIALDTKVVRIGSPQDVRQKVFNPDAFGKSQFPRIRGIVEKRAANAADLAKELAADKKKAIADHGTMSGPFPVMAVRFTGTVGEGKSGIFTVAVDGLPAGTVIRVQTGPAINGTGLRDFPGDIDFGGFKNQIEYQNAGAGINRAMSAAVLGKLDRAHLTGKIMTVTGVFTLINPKNWLVTPVALEVK